MFQYPKTFRFLLVLLVLFTLNGCSWLDQAFPDRSHDYKKAAVARSLDLPPDMKATETVDSLIVSEQTAVLSGYEASGDNQAQDCTSESSVSESVKALRFESDHGRYWLVVTEQPQVVWAKAREFWLENGYLIATENVEARILQTSWAEKQANVPQGMIRELLGRALSSVYSSAYQDRYRMRLERGEEAGTTEIYISHQGVEEILTSDSDEGAIRWGSRPRDPGFESELLKRMMVYMDTPAHAATEAFVKAEQAPPAPARAALSEEKDGKLSLLVYQEYPSAWRSVGIVLDRIDFAVEGRNRSEGIYTVRYSDPLAEREQGLLSRMAFWSGDKEQEVVTYQIRLQDDTSNTRVVVLDEQGEIEHSDTAGRILKLLFEELR